MEAVRRRGPWAGALVELTRMNCSRCSVSLSAMKPTTQIGKCETFASRIAADRCWPSTIQPGFCSSGCPLPCGITRKPGRLKVEPHSSWARGSNFTRLSNATTMALGIIGLSDSR